jgi:2-polyprenyl-3-methyl-5-hydroxy-6-metoxy-1,4-benzoquinol methylase
MAKFLIHPADLAQRRKRCEPEAARLRKLRQEVVVSCNICSSPRHTLVAGKDRYGLPLRSALCLDCGLLYLVDRFTFSGYSEFYGSGSYRTVSSQFLGSTHTIQQVQGDQLSYAKNLTSVLSGFVPRRREGKLLDVGGSAGIVAREFVKAFGLQGTVLDPATDEIAAARAAGLDAVVGSVEDWQTGDKFDLILLCRSIEHMFDLRLALTRIRSMLAPDGLFFCDIADFMEMCRMVGAPETFTKVDHCYLLTQTTALSIFRAVGFELVSMSIVSSFGYVGFLLRPCEPLPVQSAATDRVLSQVEEIQKIEREWRAFGSTALGPADWFHRKAYRAKRRIIRLLPAPSRKAKPLEEVAPAAPVRESPKGI